MTCFSPDYGYATVVKGDEYDDDIPATKAMLQKTEKLVFVDCTFPKLLSAIKETVERDIHCIDWTLSAVMNPESGQVFVACKDFIPRRDICEFHCAIKTRICLSFKHVLGMYGSGIV